MAGPSNVSATILSNPTVHCGECRLVIPLAFNRGFGRITDVNDNLRRVLEGVAEASDKQLCLAVAYDRYGRDLVEHACHLDLCGVDEGTFWTVDPVLYLTRSGTAALVPSRAVAGRSRAAALVEWLRGSVAPRGA